MGVFVRVGRKTCSAKAITIRRLVCIYVLLYLVEASKRGGQDARVGILIVVIIASSKQASKISAKREEEKVCAARNFSESKVSGVS